MKKNCPRCVNGSMFIGDSRDRYLDPKLEFGCLQCGYRLKQGLTTSLKEHRKAAREASSSPLWRRLKEAWERKTKE